MKKLANITMFESLCGNSGNALSDLSVFNEFVVFDGWDIYYNNSPEYKKYIMDEIIETYPDKNPSNITEEDMNEYKDMLLRFEWDDFKGWYDRNIVANASSIVVNGTVGRWNGTFNVDYQSPDKNTLANVIHHYDIDHIQAVINDDGSLTLKLPHHDGTNSYTLTKLNEEGTYIKDCWEYDRDTFDEEYPNLPTDEDDLLWDLVHHYAEPIVFDGY